MSALKPEVDSTHDLGTTALRWRNLFVDGITVTDDITVAGNLTVTGATTTVTTTDLQVSDRLISLGTGSTATTSHDIGFIGRHVGSTITAGSFVTGRKYRIKTAGSTTFTDVGAADNSVGTEFVATGAGAGTGTADEVVHVGLFNDRSASKFRLFSTGAELDGGTPATTIDPTHASYSASTLIVLDLEATQDLAVTRDSTIGGTLGVTGVATLGDALNVSGLASLDGGIDVDGAFTVANTTGHIATSGDLTINTTKFVVTGASGNLAINTDKFTVAGATGNTLVAGSLHVDGGATVNSLVVEDLINNRVLIAGAGGEVEDSASLTFDGTTLTVTGAADITTNVDIGGTLDADGAATLGSTLGVSGATTLNSTLAVTGLANLDGGIEVDNGGNKFTVASATGNTAIAGTLDVDGDTDLDAVSISETLGVTGATTLSSTLAVTGATTLSDTLGVTGATTLTTLTTSGISSLRSDVKVGADESGNNAKVTIASATGNLSSDGSGSFGTTLGVTGATTLGNTLGVTGATTLGGTLAVTGLASLNAGIAVDTDKFTVADATGNTVIAGTLALTGAGTFTADLLPSADGGADLGADLTRWGHVYTDALDVTGASDLDGALDVAGATTLSSTLGVTGATTLSSTLGVTGATTLSDTLGVSGAATLSSTLGVTGLANLNGGIEVDNGGNKFTVDTSGNINSSGNLVLAGNLTVNGVTTTVNSTTVTIDDPVFTLGGDAAPGSDDDKDRGIEFRWHTEGAGGEAKVGFFGFDDSEGKFTFIPQATNTAEVFSGNVGDVKFGGGTFTSLDCGTISPSSGDLTISASGNVIIDDVFNVTGATTLSSTLGVTGATTLGSTLAVAGLASLNAGIAVDTNKFTVADATGDTVIAGTLDVAGNTDLDVLNVAGAATLSSTLGVTGATTLSDTLGVSGATTLSSTLAVVGLASLNAGIAVDTNKFTVADTTGDTAIAGTLDVAGLASLDGGIDVDGAFTVADSTGNIATTGTLDVGGLASLDGGIDVDGAFTVADTSGNIATTGSLHVDAGATVNSLIVEDLTNDRVLIAGVSSEVEDSANLTFDGTTLTATDIHISNSTASSSSITGALTVAGGAGIADDLYVGDTLSAGGDITINGTTAVNTGDNDKLLIKHKSSATIDTAIQVVVNDAEEATGLSRFKVDSSGNVTMSGTLTVSNSITSSAGQLQIADSLVALNSGATADVDIGVYGKDSSNKYLGLIYDTSLTTPRFRLYHQLATEPTTNSVSFGSGEAAILEVGGLTTDGAITHSVTETTSGAYVVDNDQSDYIINATHGVTLLADGVAAPAGRELLIVNTSGSAINVTTNDTANLYVGGSATGLGSGHSLAANSSLKIVGVGGHWYAI